MSTSPKVSVCISTYNKREALAETLFSILLQRGRTPFDFEVIVVDDGSTDGTPDMPWAGMRYVRLERPGYGNPAVPLNVAYKMARGEIIITNAADVLHAKSDTIENLAELELGQFRVATVCNVVNGVRQLKCYASPDRARPRLFLGSFWRRDIYRVGGLDEDFTEPGFDDDYLAACFKSHGIEPVFSWEIIGHHQHHTRPDNLSTEIYPRMQEVFKKKMEADPPYVASGGPWGFCDPEHWRAVHKSQDHYWLSGTGGPTVADQHELRAWTDGPPLRWLDIGVGVGGMAAWLKDRGHYVVSVDVVEEAFDGLAADETRLVYELQNTPALDIDIACAHIVFQHLNDGQAIEAIAGALRHLKPGGFLAANFTGPLDTPADPQWVEAMRARGLLFLRSCGEVKKLAKLAGGRILSCGLSKKLQNCVDTYYRIEK